MEWQIEILEGDNAEIAALIRDINADIQSKEDYLHWLNFIEEHRAFNERQRRNALAATRDTLARIERALI